MGITIGELLETAVRNRPNEEAVVEPAKGIRWTYDEWNKQINRCANVLCSLGVKKGDIVSTYLYNGSEFATAYFACAKIGAIINPINFRLKPQELTYILKDAAPKVVLFESALLSTVSSIYSEFPTVSFLYIDKDVPVYALPYHTLVNLAFTEYVPTEEVDENDVYSIMYTSGTTGHPKGVLHRHREMIEHSEICLHYLKYTNESRAIIAAPMFHCAELHAGFLPRVQVGATNVILHHFDAKQVLQTIQEEKITTFFAAPTMWNMLLQENLANYDLSSMKVGLYGGASMAPALVIECLERLNVNFIQAYGMTEMGPAIAFLTEEDQLRKPGSAGKTGLRHEIRIVRSVEGARSNCNEILAPYEVGEILVKGPCMMAGYYKREEITEKAISEGWYHSGDLGYMDSDGYLYVADRVDDMIISGATNIYPREIEDHLYAHEGVLDVAVVGEPDPLWGHVVTAYVVKKNASITVEQLDMHFKMSDSIADYKRPRHYIFVDELPRNASGKLQKFILREKYRRTRQ